MSKAKNKGRDRTVKPPVFDAAPFLAQDPNLRPALRPEDSPTDLMLRGFGQAEILERTGVDVGYNGHSLRRLGKGVDRLQYKVEHVAGRLGETRVSAAIHAYAAGASKNETLALLGLSGENTVILKRLFSELGRAADFALADTSARRRTMRAGMLAKYGVPNPFELTAFQRSAEQTRLQRYGGKYTLSADSTLAATARASFTRRMTDKSFADDLRGRKTAATFARYGVKFPSQSPEIQVRTRATSQNRYGVDHASQRPEARLRQAALTLADGKRRAAKARQTNLRRFGVEHISQLPENRERQSKLMSKSYAERSMKARVTTLRRFGVEYASQRKERREEHSLFMKTNAAEFVTRSRETSLQRYGVVSHAQTEERRRGQSRRMLDPRHQERINAAKRANNSFNSSRPEEDLYLLLTGHFGEHDVLREYREQRYPYRCDFYIPSRDLFIELNGTWTHGGHWFEASSVNDRQLVEVWQKKNTDFYKTAVVQWCERDTAKRRAAAIRQLNYATFWNSRTLNDARFWLSTGAPDSFDWEREYSWLPVGVMPATNHPQRIGNDCALHLA
ncbi:hypothetical protein [Arthrobacter sp. ZGTC412]|uniref:hypothetical protein n=1 Tax=Arthrobacter sp. ZGTC412 TaxID=2058900 RepID=UPI0011B08B29|nr:hypothetical protein [Arthrobacter sp. ZGTC412]